MKSQRYYKSFN